ncbi:D-alanyl-D-alanine carboxypeptidase family protein [Lachnoclostridium edouardi]|uniref:D-alanyl-D-alanine carboxypeptidase family protein n=1 Tax=Lachnoclostridium edouardi TaxID=1926283 RepID=UPI000C7DA7C4|nr:D-alanyl-D-alanine carboxypeptidase family protein [Lachnoclostridium edouardi]
MRRMISILLCLIFVAAGPGIVSYAKPEWPTNTGVESESGIVMDVDSGTVIFAQNIHETKPPASITKLLTALIVIEHANLEDTVTFSYDAVYNVEAGAGNKMNIEEGDQLSVKDCLYLLLLQSSNQSANALAEHVAGSRDAFVEMMNQKVAAIGCEDGTHFANPSGLNDDSQVVSAYDMALIAREAFKNPTLLEIDSAKSYQIPATKNNPNGRTFYMEHKMLDEEEAEYYPAAVAGKTGYTSLAGQTLVTLAEKDGKRLVAVTLKSTGKTHYKDTTTILDFSFQLFKNVNISENETFLTGQEPVDIGGVSYEPGEVWLDQEAVVTLPNDAAFTDGERSLETALSSGAPENAVGLLTYTYNERKIGQAYIYTNQTADTSEDENNQSSTDQPEQDSRETGGKALGADTFSGAKTAGAVAAAICIIAAASAFWYKKRQDAQRERQRILREKRRKRLQEIGCSEEEFRRMMEERKNRSGR